MSMRSRNLSSGITIFLFNIALLMLLNFLYGSQGVSGYMYIPIQLINLVLVTIISLRFRIFSVYFFLCILYSTTFYFFVRGSSNNRTPFKDLNTVINADKISTSDLINPNSLIRKIAYNKTCILGEYYYVCYMDHKKNKVYKSAIYKDAVTSEIKVTNTSEFRLKSKCLFLEEVTNTPFCFISSLKEIENTNDNFSVIVLSSSEISVELKVDKLWMYFLGNG